ncbi:MAG: hypothetical protein H6719_13435 [Sandaracinaceae bacterium]|nr:hypothetical protein [Sandaracinaceae bacterium]
MRLASILALLAALGPLGARRAEAQEPARQVVVATDATLATRIRGQTADLPLELIEAPPVESFERSLALGRDRGAPFVVFATETPAAQGLAALTIHVVEVEPRRMLARQIPADGPDDRSAQLEAAALIVRSALRDLSEGGHVGVAMPGPPRPGTPVAPAPIAEAAPGRTVGVRMEVGWSASLDDHAPYGVQAPSLAGVVEVERLRLGLRVEVGLPVELTDDRAVLEVMRVRPTLTAQVDLLEEDEIGLTLGAELGVALWHRSTEIRQAGLVATDARWSASLLVGPAVGLEVFPSALGGVAGIVVAAGADIVPSAPTFAYQIDGVSVDEAALWPVQPWLRVALAVQGR